MHGQAKRLLLQSGQTRLSPHLHRRPKGGNVVLLAFPTWTSSCGWYAQVAACMAPLPPLLSAYSLLDTSKQNTTKTELEAIRLTNHAELLPSVARTIGSQTVVYTD